MLTATSAAAQSLTGCTNHANGYCINMLDDGCPSGYYVSYSGCSFLEQCCYIPDSHLPATTPHPGVSNSSCGVSNYHQGNKIVGGTETFIEKYPWQISLQFDGFHTCGGTIISDTWILTAAHCIVEQTPPVYTWEFTVVAGSSIQSVTSYSSNRYSVAKVIHHPGYVKNVRNDIALVKLSTPLILTGAQKKPICLADPGDDFSGQVCVATGWGSTAEGLHSQTYLREVDLPIITHSLCTYYLGTLDDKTVCAGQRTGGKDTCQGDSGGPLICQNSQGVWKQIGIVSYGIGCARPTYYGVYTDVSKFRSWIQSTIATN